MFHKHRLEALSDAVIAIAMTLLILDIKVPAEVPSGELAAALSRSSHEWISFAVTFFLTALFWTFQHRAFDVLEEAGPESVALTFAFLAAITVLPFSTSLWGHHLKEHLAEQIYLANQLFIALTLFAKVELARLRRRIRNIAGATDLRLRLACMVGIFMVMLVAARFLSRESFALLAAVLAISVRVVLTLSRKRATNRPAPDSI